MRISDKRGFSFLEIIISLAILSIIALVMLSVFTTSFKFLADAGNKSRNSYINQKVSENRIAGQTLSLPTGVTQSLLSSVLPDGKSGITVHFDGLEIQVPGKVYKIKSGESTRSAELTVFVPD